MKRRSNTTTFILVVALLTGVAFVSAAFNPAPSAPTPEKHDHDEDKTKQAELPAKTPPSISGKAPDKAPEAEPAHGPSPAAQKGMQEEMTKMNKMRKEMEAKMPKPADDPNSIDVSPDYYHRNKAGTEGSTEMVARMKQKEIEIKKIRADMAKMPPPSKEAQEMMKSMMQKGRD